MDRRKTGDGSFTKVTAGPVVTDTADSVGGSWGDYDNDGDLDLFVANYGNDVNFLYTNNGDGTFTKVTSGPVVTEPGDSTGSAWVDYDNDGDRDLLVSNDNLTPQNDLYRNNGNGTFTKITEGALVTDEGQFQAVSCSDIDNDGDVDLFFANRNGDNFLYENAGNGNNEIRIKCIGVDVNDYNSAIGARVKVKAVIAGSVVWQMQEITGQTGPGSQSSMVLSFGLGDALTVDEIHIQWPSGVTETFTDVPANQLLEITENQAGQAAGTGSEDDRYKRNETEFSNAFETHAPYYNGANRHGPNMENYAGSTATPAGTNVSGIKTSTMVDTYYIYSFDGKLMAEYDHDGNCVKEYIYLGGQLIAEYQPQTSKYYYYASDQINSTRVVLDDNADIVHSSAYGPYGQVLDNITTTYEPKLKFSGKEREGYSDLDYFGARYYDHQSLRFNSIDPIINREEALVNPQLWNLYAYCRNNPITYLDPDGRRIEIVGSKKFKSQIYQMINYLMKGSKVANKVLLDLIHHPETVYIKDYGKKLKMDYDRKANAISINPLAGGEFENGKIVSPALLFLHEAGHALRDLNDPAGFLVDTVTEDAQYGWKEEGRVIKTIQNPAARELGEPVRHTYYGKHVKVTGPISRKKPEVP